MLAIIAESKQLQEWQDLFELYVQVGAPVIVVWCLSACRLPSGAGIKYHNNTAGAFERHPPRLSARPHPPSTSRTTCP